MRRVINGIFHDSEGQPRGREDENDGGKLIRLGGSPNDQRTWGQIMKHSAALVGALGLKEALQVDYGGLASTADGVDWTDPAAVAAWQRQNADEEIPLF